MSSQSNAMSLDEKVSQILHRALSVIDDQGKRGTRLLDDAARLWGRVQHLLGLELLSVEPDLPSLELACYALQFPLPSGGKSGKPLRHTPRDRAEHAASKLQAVLSHHLDSAVIERVVRLLHELPIRTTGSEEARLLSDAVNLDDFGVTAMLLQAVSISRNGGGISQVLDGLEKRDAYGYWDARLKDGFHFEVVRKIARQRLEHVHSAAALLHAELSEDRALERDATHHRGMDRANLRADHS